MHVWDVSTETRRWWVVLPGDTIYPRARYASAAAVAAATAAERSEALRILRRRAPSLALRLGAGCRLG